MNKNRWQKFGAISEIDEGQNDNDKLIQKLHNIQNRLQSSTLYGDYSRNNRSITERTNTKGNQNLLSSISVNYRKEGKQNYNCQFFVEQSKNNSSRAKNKAEINNRSYDKQKNKKQNNHKSQFSDENLGSILQHSLVSQNQLLKQKIHNLQEKLYDTKGIVENFISENQYIMKLQQIVQQKNIQNEQLKNTVLILNRQLSQKLNNLQQKASTIMFLQNKIVLLSKEINQINNKYQPTLQIQNNPKNSISNNIQNPCNFLLKPEYGTYHNKNISKGIIYNEQTKYYEGKNNSPLKNQISQSVHKYSTKKNFKEIYSNKQNENSRSLKHTIRIISPQNNLIDQPQPKISNKCKYYQNKSIVTDKRAEQGFHNFYKTTTFQQYKPIEASNKFSDLVNQGKTYLRLQQSNIEERINYLKQQNKNLKKKLFD